jgi:hypothetical protein
LIIKHRTDTDKSFVGHKVEREESPGVYPVLYILGNIIIEPKCESQVLRGVSDSDDPVRFVVIVLILVLVEYIVVSEPVSQLIRALIETGKLIETHLYKIYQPVVIAMKAYETSAGMKAVKLITERRKERRTIICVIHLKTIAMHIKKPDQLIFPFRMTS